MVVVVDKVIRVFRIAVKCALFDVKSDLILLSTRIPYSNFVTAVLTCKRRSPCDQNPLSESFVLTRNSTCRRI